MTTALDIHPEDLIDKLAHGGLNDLEQGRLRGHLALCASCRFEIATRSELAVEPTRGKRPQLNFVIAPEAPPSAPPAARPEELTEPRAPITLKARARRRWALVLVAAAFVLFAGAATAAVVSGTLTVRLLPWLARAKSPAVSDLAAALDAKRVAATPAVASVTAVDTGAPPVAAEEPVAIASAPSPAASSARVAPPRALSTRPSLRRSAQAPAAPSVAPAEVAAASAKPLLDVPAANHVAPDASAPTDVPPRTDAAAMFAEANRARRDGNGERAVQLYRALQARYPSAAESGLSRAVLAQMLLERGNAAGALSGFDRYLADGTPVLSAEALVGRARALEQLGKQAQAVAAWKQVQSRFPGSVHARLAAVRLAALDMR